MRCAPGLGLALCFVAACGGPAREPVDGGGDETPAVDAGARDLGVPDAGVRDAGAGDARVDAAPPDAGCTTDADGDGHRALACGGDDCDDAVAAVHPGATETCNLRDDDCNGTIDDVTGTTLYFADCDGDGYGAGTPRCAAPPTPPACAGGAWVTTGGDCDDTTILVAPHLAEECNGLDDDCNGLADDGLSADTSCWSASLMHVSDAHCVAAACVLTCSAPYLDCTSGGAGDLGCETDPRTAALHCGDCAHACPFECRASACEDATSVLDAGYGTTCVGRVSGALVCWGDDAAGQRGTGVRFGPPGTDVLGIDDVTSVSHGDFFACATRAGGTVRCWGAAEYGQLGDGIVGHALCPTYGMRECSATPVDVLGITDATQVAAGSAHACAVHADGTVSCWGANDRGQLGDGTLVNRPRPVVVAGLTGAVQVAATESGSCARLTDGSVTCWGSAATGLVPMAGIDDAIDITARTYAACVVRATGAVACWGSGIEGELGDGMPAFDHPTPVAVVGVTDGVQVSMGAEHACVLHAGGTVSCWGHNAEGQLGDGTTVERDTPVPVVGLDDAVRVSAGGRQTCAVRATGGVVCWGTDPVGELGTAGGDSPTPAPVVPP